jgi:CRP-like cAMP-binding protein
MLRTQHKKKMIKYLPFLQTTPLFEGIDPKSIEIVCKRLQTQIMHYTKGEMIIFENETVSHFGIIIDGTVQSIKHLISGKTIIVTQVKRGGNTGILLSSSKHRKSPVSVEAVTNVTLLSIPIDKLVSGCDIQTENYHILMRNYLNMLSEKSMFLHDRIDCLIRPTVREKIATYLLQVSKQHNSPTFTIPFDRNGMANYLNVDRSALSRELSTMKKEQLIDYHKNAFTLLTEDYV